MKAGMERFCGGGRPEDGTSGGLGRVTQAVIGAATFQAQRRILKAAIAAKIALGLDSTSDSRDLAEMTYQGPTLVASMRIVGWREEPMYADHPTVDFGSFKRRLAKWTELPFQTLADAMSSISDRRVLELWFGDWRRYELPRPDETGTGIAHISLLDNLGHVVAEAAFDREAGLQWQATPAMTATEIAAALGRADELERMATFEASWDNFSTAERLRDDAAQLRRQVSIVQHAPRVAQSTEGAQP